MLDSLSKLTISAEPSLQTVEKRSSDFPFPNLVRSYLIAFITAFFITIIQLMLMLVGIRRNLLQVFRGDHCEIPRYNSLKNEDYITGTFHFAGYLIGCVIVAYIFLAVILLIVLVAIDALVTYGNVRFIEIILKFTIPTFLLVMFKTYLNKILGRYIFLQHGGEILSINNWRAFMVFIYFNFFLDAFLGLVAAVVRLLKSTVGGVLYICRLDCSPLGRKLETCDAGFSAYCGFIFVECAHRHPVLLYFVSHLLRDYLYRKTKGKRLSRARCRWYLAIFLMNNPTLIYSRKRFLTGLRENEMKMVLIGRKNMNEVHIQQPSILGLRASIISAKDLETLR